MKRRYGVVTFSLLMSSVIASAKCVSPRATTSLSSGRASDFYLHPEGDIALIKDSSGNVTFLDLRSPGNPKILKTDLPASAFPVSSTWSHMLFTEGGKTKLVEYEAGKVSGKDQIEFPSEILMITTPPGRSDRGVKLRFLTADGKIHDNFLRKGKMIAGESRSLCANLASPVHPLTLSPDGDQILTSNLTTTQVYRIGKDGNCEFTAGLPYLIGDASFNFSYENRSLVFEATRTYVSNGLLMLATAIHIYHQESKKIQRVSLDGEEASDPSYLRDGRVAYLDHSKNTIVTVDPLQLDKEGQVLTSATRCVQVK